MLSSLSSCDYFSNYCVHAVYNLTIDEAAKRLSIYADKFSANKVGDLVIHSATGKATLTLHPHWQERLPANYNESEIKDLFDRRIKSKSIKYTFDCPVPLREKYLALFERTIKPHINEK